MPDELMSIDDAILKLRNDPQYADLVFYSYFSENVADSAERFAQSGEFRAVVEAINYPIQNAVVVDIGAGTGIASYAFAQLGAKQVYALEPDPSDFVGRGAIHRIKGDYPIESIDAFADKIPLPDNAVDIIYARQVLHHIPDLQAAMREFHRILKPNGVFIACREHVVDDEQQKQIFLKNHVMHQLTRSENAYSLEEYTRSIEQGGLVVKRVFKPWDTVINVFPMIQEDRELPHFFKLKLEKHLKFLGKVIGNVPLMYKAVQFFYNRLRNPGRIYTFIAYKP